MFDGVHRGHRFLIERLVAEGRRRGLRTLVVTFDRHPLTEINPILAPKLLMSTDERIAALGALGADRVEVLAFDSALRRLTARQFAENVLQPLGVRAVLLGYDNAFGSDRLKTLDEYAAVLNPCGIEVIRCTPFNNPDSADIPASSAIRRALAVGDVASANDMLGRPFTISGTVVGGRRLGRTLGFPTANLDIAPDTMLPASGVYAGTAQVPLLDKTESLPALVNIGTAPTVNGPDARRVIVEVHIDTDIPLDLYDKHLTVSLFRRIRDERRFPDVDALREALHADLADLRRCNLN